MNALLKFGLCTFALTTAAFADAAELGRLFYTPEERAHLDYSYAQQAQPDSDSRGTISVTGIVQKHGGQRTIWINGVPRLAGKNDERSPESATIPVPGQKKQVRVKVGQKVYLDSTTPEQ